MKIIVWLSRITLFAFFFVFALFNTGLTTLNYVLGQWQAPLALILLIFFIAGTLFGMVVLLPTLFRQRAEIKRLSRSPSNITTAAATPEATPLSPRPAPLTS